MKEFMETYLDYNSTSPVDPMVAEAMKPYFLDDYGNPSSFHRKGQAARHAIEASREKIADLLSAEPGDIIFTSGGTESDNLALKGAMESLGSKRRHLVVSAIEHQAVLQTAKYLKTLGFDVSFAPVDQRGIVDLDRLKEMITDETALLSIMHVNNEVGTIQPIKEAARIAHDKGALFHTDAVQSFGKLEIDPESVSSDMLSISAHKLCGPKGAGALYLRKGLEVKPLFHGGHQEKNIRPGTENVATIVGFGRAAEIARKDRTTETARVLKLRNKLSAGLQKAISDIQINGDPESGIYNTLNVSFKGLEGETLLVNLDLKDIFVSTGSACTAGSIEPSHVLIAMGLSEKLARAAIRFSLGRFTTESEIDHALKEIPPIIERLRKTAVK